MKPASFWLSVLLVTHFSVLPVLAQQGGGGNDGEAGPVITVNLPNDPALVSQALNTDGSLNYANMTDLGTITAAAEWMPSVFGFEVPATYHQYITNEGNLVLVPTMLTDLNGRVFSNGIFENGVPEGYYNPGGAIAVHVIGQENLPNGVNLAYDTYGTLAYDPSMSMAPPSYDPSTHSFDMSALGDYLGISPEKTSAQLKMSANSLYDLFLLALKDSRNSGSLTVYGNTSILIYPDCASSPVGCTEEFVATYAAVVPPASVVAAPPQCPPPYTTTGPITASGGPGAGEGGKLAPLHPVVVGQDPQRRGVDIQAQVQVPLITYHYFETLRHEELLCMSGPAHPANTGCPGPASRYANPAAWTSAAVHNQQNYEQLQISFECIEHTRSYTDFLSSVTLNLSLTEGSRIWILTSLEQAYPGAHLKQPSFAFRFPGPGTAVLSGVSWTQVTSGIPVEDPGWWAVTVSVLTSGTPVSGARFVTLPIGQFLDELVRVSLSSGSQP